jgi:hypothetical protein
MDRSRGRGLSGWYTGTPEVGRGRGIPPPRYTSTPMDSEQGGAWGGARPKGKNDEELPWQDRREKASQADTIDIKELKIQHLSEMLDSERRVVKLLSFMSNIQLEEVREMVEEDDRVRQEEEEQGWIKEEWVMPKLDTIKEDIKGLRMGPGEQSMPMLETLIDDGYSGKMGKSVENQAHEMYQEGGHKRETLIDYGNGGKMGKSVGKQAHELYQESRQKKEMLKPERVESQGVSGLKTAPVREDLEWYEDSTIRDDRFPREKVSVNPKQENVETKCLDRSELGRGGRAPRLKPSRYDGLTPYEDYCVQFSMVAELNEWTDEDKALYLVGCLSGSARSVLNDMSPKDRYKFIKLDEALRERFGTDDQAELFKAKLRSRVKGKDESLQELAHDVRRLVRLAYPNAAMNTHDDLTKDQFIEALGDSEIRWSVFQARPKNVTEALKVAMELEAFKESEKSRLRKSVRGVQVEEEGKVEKRKEIVKDKVEEDKGESP